jgi:hypothetical protein
MSEKQPGSALLGLVGFARAGKGTLVEHLEARYGFLSVKPSSFIETALQERYGARPFAREEYSSMAHELRSLHGPCYYLKDLDFGRRLLIDGPRHLTTSRFISQRGGTNIGLVALPGVRFERSQRSTDSKLNPTTLSGFMSAECGDMNALGPRGGQLLPMLWEIAPECIIDTSSLTIDMVNDAVDVVLGRIGITPVDVDRF